MRKSEARRAPLLGGALSREDCTTSRWQFSTMQCPNRAHGNFRLRATKRQDWRLLTNLEREQMRFFAFERGGWLGVGFGGMLRG